MQTKTFTEYETMIIELVKMADRPCNIGTKTATQKMLAEQLLRELDVVDAEGQFTPTFHKQHFDVCEYFC